MSLLRSALLAGVAVLSLAGMAWAQTPRTHVMSIQLPGGEVAQIRYAGNVPPRVVVMPAGTSLADVQPWPAFAGPSPYAFERIMADMDRQMAAMMRMAESMASQPFPGGLTETGLGTLPAGSNVCFRSVEITQTGNDTSQVVSRTAGNCGGAASTTLRPAAPVHRPDTIRVRDTAPPEGGLLHRVEWHG